MKEKLILIGFGIGIGIASHLITSCTGCSKSQHTELSITPTEFRFYTTSENRDNPPDQIGP